MAASNDYSVLKKLGLKDPPIGVKYSFFRPKEIPAMPDDWALSLCEMLRRAQTDHHSFYFSKENNETCTGKIWLGMEDMTPFAESGQIGERLGVFQEARSNQHLYQYVPRMDRGIVNYVSFAPVDQMPYDPDVLVISATPNQAEMVLRAASYSSGMVYSSTSTPVMGCAWFLIQPYKTGEINYVLPALIHGPHGRELYPEDTILVSIPYQWIPTVLQNLEEMELHLPSHSSKKAYYDEFEGILSDLAEEAKNP